MKKVIRTENICKYYQTGSVQVKAVDGVTLEVIEGEFLAIIGASGSGKSTFLNLIGCLDKPTKGEYYLDGNLVNGLNKNQLADIRNQKIGFVFQGYNLLSRTSMIFMMPMPPTSKDTLAIEARSIVITSVDAVCASEISD